MGTESGSVTLRVTGASRLLVPIASKAAAILDLRLSTPLASPTPPGGDAHDQRQSAAEPIALVVHRGTWGQQLHRGCPQPQRRGPTGGRLLWVRLHHRWGHGAARDRPLPH